MENRKYSALIIGCGNMGVLNDAPGSGNEHKTISYAKALKENGNFDVFYRDKDYWKIENAIELWGGYFDDDAPKDVVIIATPDERHYIDLVEAKEYNPKLVICEKPLCNDVLEAKAIIQMYEELEIPILVDYTRRFIPELQDLKKRYYSGEFGDLVSVSLAFNRGELHTGTHGYDFLNWFFGKEYDVNGFNESGWIDDFVDFCDYRIFQIQLFFEKFFWQEQRIGDMPVPSYYDYHTRYVIDNAYNFLEGKEELKCTAKDGLKALEIMERLCK